MTQSAFSNYGDVLTLRPQADMIINDGRCERHHDLARLSFEQDGKAGISFFYSEPVSLPLTVDLLERHPLGSQAFLPMSGLPWLVVVADDDDGTPTNYQAFSVKADQGINLLANVWHAVLMPLQETALFAVIDRIGGSGNNLEVHHLDTPFVVS